MATIGGVITVARPRVGSEAVALISGSVQPENGLVVPST